MNQEPAITSLKVNPSNATALAHVFLSSSCAKVPGVGPKLLEKLASLEIRTLQDLLWHFPRDFEDRRSLKDVNQAGQLVGTKAQFELTIQHSNIIPGKTPRLIVHCVDAHNAPEETLQLLFFKPQHRQAQQWQQQRQVRVFGEVSYFANAGIPSFQITHPDYVFLNQKTPPLDTALTPIYPSAQGIHQKSWRRWLGWLLQQLTAAPFSIDLLEPVWQDLAPQYNSTIPLLDAFKAIHEGQHMVIHQGQLQIDRTHPAVQRLALDELVRHQIRWAPRQSTKRAKAIKCSTRLNQEILKNLPFSMTNAQQRCTAEIQKDLESTTPMMRLLQGDVGSGKTLVAALAAAQVTQHAGQVAVLAPTEILARQHERAFTEFLSPLNITVQLLIGKLKSSERQNRLEEIRTGKTQIIIGTHALFQKEVQYHNLVFIIVDEQHRFGVEQRLSLVKKGLQTQQNQQKTQVSNSQPPEFETNLIQTIPHQLMMSATPIPRTLTMSIYAHLTTSIIDELPPNRKTVITRAIGECRREELYERVRNYIASGQQVFWVCPLIHESDTSGEKKSVDETFAQLTHALPNTAIGLLHGQLDEEQKKNALHDFIANKTQLLIATSMVEVGVNIPNANLMIVEDAQNWGLTQLHQLRGRVGRGDAPGFMLLLHKSPLPQIAHNRLDILRRSSDGFEIAEKDLEIRGPGHIQGTAQSGHWTFKIVDLQQDQALFAQAKNISAHLLQNHQKITQIMRG